jgi:DNA invertase Pin-like site-specific DNA recombinase
MSRRPTRSSVEPETRRVAIYTRKSTTMGLEQEFNSLDSQRESCLAYIQRQPGWKLVDERYDDGGFTGANIDRPAFTRLMADVEASKVDVIVVYKVDRLSRSLLDFVKVMERLGAAGASFVSVTQNFSTADAMGRLTMNMLMSFAEFEREMISERTRDKIAGARRKGKWTGGPVPYGYSVKDKKLLVNELEARVVREAFDLFLMHRQQAKVAHLLNERMLLPRGSKVTKKLAWSKEGIGRILKSPIYAGFMMYGDELHPGEHPPLIEESTYRAAQAILAGTSRVVRWTGTNPDYVLRGLVRCALCGEMMCPGSTTKPSTGKTHRYYRCSRREKYGKDQCAGRPLPAAALEEFVVARISNATADGSLAERVAKHLETLTAGKGEDFGKLRAELATKIAECSANASRLTDELVRLDGRARELVEQKLGVEADRLAASEQQLRDLERDAAELEIARKDHAWFVAALRDFAKVWVNMSPDNQGRFLRALIDKVVVDEHKGTCRVELIDFGAASGPKEAA